VPNNQIYKFSGFVYVLQRLKSFYISIISIIFSLNSDGTKEGVNRDNVLLRGCEIRNTDYVEGIVIYAGEISNTVFSEI